MRRAWAVMAAVVMLAGAWWLRSSIHDEKTPSTGPVADDVVLRCDDVAALVCSALSADGTIADGSSQAPGRTVDGGLDPEPHVWLVAEPWAALADDDTRAGAPGLGETELVAWSPMTLVVWNDRRAALASACGAIDWVCVGETAGSRWTDHDGSTAWGFVKPGHADLDTTAGLFAVGQFTVQYFAARDIDSVASNDFDPTFRSTLGRLERALPANPTLQSMLTFGPSALDITAEVEAVARPAIDESREAGNLQVIAPGEPAATVRLVLVGVGGAEIGDDLRRAVAAALTDQGWKAVTDAAPAPPSGLPNAGVLEALRRLAAEA